MAETKVTKIIYKRPVNQSDLDLAMSEFAEFQRRLSFVKFAIDKNLFPPTMINKLQMELDIQMQNISKLLGFESSDDLNYWVKNFMNKG